MALYDEVLNVARPYLGPAAERFLTRQIEQHLDTNAQGLGRQHLDELAKWCLNSGKLVMDESKASDLGQKIKAL